jgi:hypothetical protein
MLYQDREACYLEHEVLMNHISDDQREELDNEGHIETELTIFDLGRTDVEGCYMQIGPDYVQWTGYPEYTSITLTTEALPTNFIEGLIKAEPKPKAKKE